MTGMKILLCSVFVALVLCCQAGSVKIEAEARATYGLMPTYRTYQSAVVPAPMQKVWEDVRNLRSLLTLAIPQSKVEWIAVEGGESGRIGARALVQIPGGSLAITYEVVGIDEESKTITYKRIVGPQPGVEHYVGKVTVFSITDSPEQAFVELRKTFDDEGVAGQGLGNSMMSSEELKNLKGHYQAEGQDIAVREHKDEL